MSRNPRSKKGAVDGCPSAGDVFRLLQCAGSWMAGSAAGAAPEPSGCASVAEEVLACLSGSCKVCVREDVADAAVWIRSQEDELCSRVFGGKQGGISVARGQELALCEGGRVALRGRADSVFLDEGSSVVLVCAYDFAVGAAVDVSGDAWQLAALAMLVARELGYVPQVYAAVLRPFAVEREVAPVFFCPADVVSARESILEVLGRAMMKDAVCDPSDAACRGCRARGMCRAFSRCVAEWGAADVEVRWRELSPARKLAAFRLARLAECVAARIDACCEAELRSGGSIPGLALSPGRQLWSVADASAAFALLSARFPRHVSAVSFARCCKVNVSDLDRLVHAARKEEDAGATAKGARSFVRDLLAPCSEVRVSKGALRECGGFLSPPGCPF